MSEFEGSAGPILCLLFNKKVTTFRYFFPEYFAENPSQKPSGQRIIALTQKLEVTQKKSQVFAGNAVPLFPGLCSIGSSRQARFAYACRPWRAGMTSASGLAKSTRDCVGSKAGTTISLS
ncbi:MAG: hypothetical protein P4L26_02905 [Terracidiphilus sp.]|nr:hypothetical protein [Terracidiphilus sp.]